MNTYEETELSGPSKGICSMNSAFVKHAQHLCELKAGKTPAWPGEVGTKSYAYLLVRVMLKDAALGRLAVLQKVTLQEYMGSTNC